VIFSERDSASISRLWLPDSIEVILAEHLKSGKGIHCISFEITSRLTQIASYAFSFSSLQSIAIEGSAFCDANLSKCLIDTGNRRFVFDNQFLIDVVDHKLIRNFSKSPNLEISSNVEILGSSCFGFVESLSSITFESNSQLKRIMQGVFHDSYVRVLLPSSILFIAHDAHSSLDELSISDRDSNVLFDRWRSLRKSRIKMYFQRLDRTDIRFRCFKDFGVDLSIVELGSVICRRDRVLTQIHQRRSDGVLTIMKIISLAVFIEGCDLAT
jgi:hypothetical protein